MKQLVVSWLFGVALVAIAGSSANCASGTLDAPAVGIPARIPLADRNRIQRALLRDDCKFISGSWLNKSTQLHYKSDTVALGKCLEELANCPSATISIGFYKPGPDARWAPENSNWSVFHSGTNNRFSFKIRLNSEIDLTALRLPPLKSNERQSRPESSPTEEATGTGLTLAVIEPLLETKDVPSCTLLVSDDTAIEGDTLDGHFSALSFTNESLLKRLQERDRQFDNMTVQMQTSRRQAKQGAAELTAKSLLLDAHTTPKRGERIVAVVTANHRLTVRGKQTTIDVDEKVAGDIELGMIPQHTRTSMHRESR